jgi:GR25 family glycosyltransferase involved in LPS biosynthesis
MMQQFERIDKFIPIVVRGVDGSTLADSVGLLLTDDSSWFAYKGAIGCFLSHVAVWELAAKQDVPFVVVLEDDADVSNIPSLHNINLPDDFEIIFINERMSPKSRLQPNDVVPMGEALPNVDLAQAGFGTDGYLLTPSGAKKLISAFLKDLCYGHVDGRLVRYATSQADLERAGINSMVSQVIQNHHNPRRLPTPGLLKGYVTSIPLVRHAATDSSRDAIDKMS